MLARAFAPAGTGAVRYLPAPLSVVVPLSRVGSESVGLEKRIVLGRLLCRRSDVVSVSPGGG
jgi:hypothetical protein